MKQKHLRLLSPSNNFLYTEIHDEFTSQPCTQIKKLELLAFSSVLFFQSFHFLLFKSPDLKFNDRAQQNTI